jgi:hypothetical protein
MSVGGVASECSLSLEGGADHGPKDLILAPRAGHNDSINRSTWTAVDAWIERWLPAKKAGYEPCESTAR